MFLTLPLPDEDNPAPSARRGSRSISWAFVAPVPQRIHVAFQKLRGEH